VKAETARDVSEPAPEVIPSKTTIALSACAAVLGIALGVVALAITEADDDLQRVLAVVGLLAGVVAGIAAAVTAARRRRALFRLGLDEAQDELRLVGALLGKYPLDEDLQERAKRLLEQTAHGHRALMASGADKEADELRAARVDVEWALATAQDRSDRPS
jgi:hypothetical protein